MKLLASLLITLLTVATTAYVAAQPRLSFDETTYDYGELQESDGFVASEFTFTNTGDTPLLITYANASCGCTTPIYPEAPIVAGETATVHVTYDTYGRPGTFSKSIKLYSNDPSSPTTLRIRGNVIPSDHAAIDVGEYPFNIGGVLLKNVHIPFFQLYTTERQSKEIAFINGSSDELRIELRTIPSHLQASLSSATLTPRQEAILRVTYEGSLANDWGVRQDSLLFAVYEGEHLLEEKYITVSANLAENFTQLSAQERAIAPRIIVSDKVIHLSDIPASSTIEQQIVIENKGQTPLVIRKIVSANTALATQLATTTVAPQQQTTLLLQLESSRIGASEFDYRIQVISNDPNTPVTPIRVVGNLK